MVVTVRRIAKIAGLGLAGFVAASIAADKANLTPLASQITGFVGAFAGTLVQRRRAAKPPAESARPATGDK